MKTEDKKGILTIVYEIPEIHKLMDAADLTDRDTKKYCYFENFKTDTDIYKLQDFDCFREINKKMTIVLIFFENADGVAVYFQKNVRTLSFATEKLNLLWCTFKDFIKYLNPDFEVETSSGMVTDIKYKGSKNFKKIDL